VDEPIEADDQPDPTKRTIAHVTFEYREVEFPCVRDFGYGCDEDFVCELYYECATYKDLRQEILRTYPNASIPEGDAHVAIEIAELEIVHLD
jgi:hypothetical protein